jgi:hypothetical protein
MDHEDAKLIGERFVRFIETSDAHGLFAADAFCDINVPEWRFQMQGSEAVEAWLAGEQPDGCEVTSWRADATENGVVVELVQKIGEEISRNMHRLEVRGDKVAAWTMYCTGVWSAETQEKQRREAPMIRE